jgi:hypothetical protein
MLVYGGTGCETTAYRWNPVVQPAAGFRGCLVPCMPFNDRTYLPIQRLEAAAGVGLCAGSSFGP